MIDDDLEDCENRPRAFSRLDATVFALTVVFWTFNALQLALRSLITPTAFNQLDGVGLARIASLLTGISLSLGLWLILRRLTETRALAWFWRAAILALGACLVHTLLNAAYFWTLTDYHELAGEGFLDRRSLASTYVSLLYPIMTWAALCAVLVAGDNLRHHQLSAQPVWKTDFLNVEVAGLAVDFSLQPHQVSGGGGQGMLQEARQLHQHPVRLAGSALADEA